MYEGQYSKYLSKENSWCEYDIKFTKYGREKDSAFATVTNVNTLRLFLIFEKNTILTVSMINVPMATQGKISYGRVSDIQIHEEFANTVKLKSGNKSNVMIIEV